MSTSPNAALLVDQQQIPLFAQASVQFTCASTTVPGTSATSARSSALHAFSRLPLPTLGRPTRATYATAVGSMRELNGPLFKTRVKPALQNANKIQAVEADYSSMLQ